MVNLLNGLFGLYKDTTGSTAIYYTHMPTGSGQILGQVVNGTAYYYLTDLRGYIVKMTGSTGTVQNTYTYDPYGNLIASTGTVTNAIRYAGGYYDTSTALYKYGARYYNPSSATWTQLDPSGKSAAYIYASDNPVNFTDPSGNITCPYGNVPYASSCANLPGAKPISAPNGSSTNKPSCGFALTTADIILGAGIGASELSAGLSFVVGTGVSYGLYFGSNAICN